MSITFTPAELDKLQIAFGTFLQDYPTFWTEVAKSDAEELFEKLNKEVYGDPYLRSSAEEH